MKKLTIFLAMAVLSVLCLTAFAGPGAMAVVSGNFEYSVSDK